MTVGLRQDKLGKDVTVAEGIVAVTCTVCPHKGVKQSMLEENKIVL